MSAEEPVLPATDLPLNSFDRCADTRVDQSACPVPPYYNEVLEHDSEPDADDDPEMPHVMDLGDAPRL